MRFFHATLLAVAAVTALGGVAPAGTSQEAGSSTEVLAWADLVLKSFANAIELDVPFSGPSVRPVRMDPPDCNGGTLRQAFAEGDQYITFNETFNRTGCGSAKIPLRLPDGAAVLSLEFVADRRVSFEGTTAMPGDPYFVQEFRFHREPDDTGLAFEYAPRPPESYELFPPDSGRAGGTGFRFTLEDIQERSVVLQWFFRDMGVFVEEAGVWSDGDRRHEAGVAAPEVQIPGVPIQVGAEYNLAESVVGERLRTWYARPLVVPASLYAQAPSVSQDNFSTMVTALTVSVRLPAAFASVSVLDPSGRTLLDEDFTLSPEGSSQILRLELPALVKNGFGNYTIVHTIDAPVEVNTALLPWAVLLLLAPLVVSGAAVTVGGWSLRRGATTSGFPVRLPWILALMLLAATCALLLAILVRDHVRLLSNWPLGDRAVVYYALLGVLAAAAFVVLVYFVQQVIRSMRRGLGDLEARGQELQAVLYGTTHDLKAPLITLDWLAKDLESELRGAAAAPEVRSALEAIRSSVGGMRGLVGDLLALSEAEQGATGPHSVDPAVALDEVKRLFAPQAAAKAAQLVTSAAPFGDLPIAPGHLKQVLSNLVSNAIKYGRDHGGRIAVRLEPIRADGSGLRVIVDDDGPGVKPADRERVFGLFQRSADARARGVEGSGLGLALVRRTTRRYGGDCTVTTSPEGGARFVATFPGRHAGTAG